jgi:hypothetical protein
MMLITMVSEEWCVDDDARTSDAGGGVWVGGDERLNGTGE